MHRIKVGPVIGLIAMGLACGPADQEKAKRDAESAKEKTRQTLHEAGREAKQLGREAKAEAKSLGNQMDRSLEGRDSAGPRSSESADKKLSDAKDTVRAAGDQAAVKLNRAALIAKVKSNLAADVGLSTVSGIDVDTSGHVVTLTGSVLSEEQKRLAEATAMQVDGVTKVVNRLKVSR